MPDEFVFYAALALFILFGPWILVWRGRRKRKRERLESDRRWSELTGRLYAVEQAVKELGESSLKPAAPPLPTTQAPAEARPPAPASVLMAPGQSPERPPVAAVPVSPSR